jgi:hypothetical protein
MATLPKDPRPLFRLLPTGSLSAAEDRTSERSLPLDSAAGGRGHRRALTLGVALFAAAIASEAVAVPVVSPGGKPGAAQSWNQTGSAVTLKLAKGFDAKVVADAISKSVAGAKAKAEGANVVVEGVPQDKLVTALEKVDVAESGGGGGGDDVDAMLANLQNQGGKEEGSGSSIRASKATDFSEVMGKKEELITAKVVDVKRSEFPLAIVTLKIASVPKGTDLDGVKPGVTISVVPRVRSKGGVVDPADQPSKLNLGAWYAQPGDTVMVRLEPNTKKEKVWIAAAFERKK